MNDEKFPGHRPSGAGDRRSGTLKAGRIAAALGLAVVASACSIRGLAVRSLADALAASGDVFASDEDPQLVRDALPFALKTIETLLGEAPEHRGLLLAACRGFTQFAYAFVETDALSLEESDYAAASRHRERALRLYLRARGYGLRAMELGNPGVESALLRNPGAALSAAREPDVALLYWTGAAWGAAISLGRDKPQLIADLPAVLALFRRALELDEDYGGGAIHEALITLESLPAAMGGSAERASEHFRRAVELSGGNRPGPFVAWAQNVSVPTQNRREFEELLRRALEIDPDLEPASRVQTIVVQQRARLLLEQADALFLEPAPEETNPS